MFTSDKNSRSRLYLGVPYFIHPFPLLAVLIVALNDHYLKQAHPSWLTGKLSDFAGLFFFPIFLCALWNLIANAYSRLFSNGKFHWLTATKVGAAIVLTDIVFVAIKLSPIASNFYVTTLASAGRNAEVTRDPSDLIALTVNLATWIYARRWFSNGGQSGSK